MKFQITFLGANTLFGRVASALLSKTPSVRVLKLYDEVDSTRLGSKDPTCEVRWHRGKEQLSDALQGSDIIVIGDDSQVISNNDKDALISSASKVVDFVHAVAQTTPKAMVVVAASPLNLMVPLAGYVLKELGCYDGRKLLGVTSVDTLRANAIYSEYIAHPNSILPVVGGASPQTRVPIFSHARPSLDLPEEDLHVLIDKIKSFDLNMEGPELKASTLERAYATVRLVNSILSGLQEESSTKEMALAKTSLIPEVNYFSLPVDLGKSGIERTFGLPELSPLETEMVDYAIINLNNDLIKAQDLYASFKPCFEMLKSIVGTNRCNDVPNEDGTLLIDPIIDTKKKKDQKMKSNKRKRSDPHIRNRKRTRANKYPILHCPAPEVVTDMPIEEKFGKIERVHKKLQVNQIFQERNANELPMLKSKDVNDIDESKCQLIDNSSSLKDMEVINNFDAKNVDETNDDSVSVLLNSAKETNSKLSFFNENTPKIIDLMDKKNNLKEAETKLFFKNKQEKSRNLEHETEPSKNVKVTIDLKCKIKNKKVDENIKSHVKSQSSRTEIKLLMPEKQKQYKKTKPLSLSNYSTIKNKIEDLKKKTIKVNISNNAESLNTDIFTYSQSSGDSKSVRSECNNDIIFGKQTNEKSNTKKLPGLSKMEITNKTLSVNDSVNGEQHIILKKDTVEHNRQILLKQKNNASVETKDEQEMDILSQEVVTTDGNQEDNNKNLLRNQVVSLKASGEIKYQRNGKRGMAKYSENNVLVERQEPLDERSSSKDETNEKSFKEDEKSFKAFTCEEDTSKTELALMSKNNNLSPHCKDNELNVNKIIQEEKIAVTAGETEIINNKSDNIIPDVSSEKSNEIKTGEKNIKQLQVYFKSETMKEAEKQFINNSVYKVIKEENDSPNDLVYEQIGEIADSKRNKEEIPNQKFSFSRGQVLDMGNPTIVIDAQEKLEKLECLSKRDMLKEDNQNITVANTTKVNYDPLEQINKIRETTLQKLKQPLKYLNSLKQKTSETEKFEETEQEKETIKTTVIEETKKINETKAHHLECKGSENIEVFSYESRNMHDTKNITNLNEMIQSLVKPSRSESSELQTGVQKSFDDLNESDHVDESKSSEMNVVNLKKKSEQIIMGNQKSKDEKLKMDYKRPVLNSNSEPKKSPKESPFPFMNKIREIPQDKSFDKCNWLKHRIETDAKEMSPVEVDEKTIDENKALTMHSRNINESFTKRVQKGQHLGKTTDEAKSVSYSIDTKSKKDELSKRYTVLKNGQICNMVKNDINANELKAKLYKNSIMRSNIKPMARQEDKENIGIKDSSDTELVSPNNKEVETISEPLSNPLEAIKKLSFNTTKDINNANNSKTSNNNAITMKNKSFLNMIVNRISKRSPALNETTDTIGVRGSHYGSGTYFKKYTPSDEQKIQQQTKKAIEQLNITRFKNLKRISPGMSGSLPVVSEELGEKRRPVTDQENMKPKDLTAENMERTKNKIQLMKEKYQRMKNANVSSKNLYAISPPSGAKIIGNKYMKKTIYGGKNPLGEVIKSPPKINPEHKSERMVMKQDEIVSKQNEQFFVKSEKENNNNALGKTKSEHHDLVSDQKDDTLIHANTHKKQIINSSEDSDKRHFTETEKTCLDFSQIPNPSTSSDNNITKSTSKTSQENQQFSQDMYKSITECFDRQQELLKTTDENGNIMGNPKPLKDETISKDENKNKIPSATMKQCSPRKKTKQDRAQETSKLKENTKGYKDNMQTKDHKNTFSKKKSEQSKKNHKNPLININSKNKKDDSEYAALKAVFSSRPKTGDLMKIKQEQKSPEPDTDNSTYPNFGTRDVIGNKFIPRHTTASYLLLDPDIEKRPTTSRKEIPPSLMHAVKPFASQNADMKKLKTNFYSRWTPQTLKLKDNKEDAQISKNELGSQKNPIVSGKVNLTSDLFKAYMKKNRNYDSANSNGDVQFLHQLTSIPQPGVSSNTRRIKDQRVAFSTLEANSEGKRILKTQTVVNSFRFQTKSKAVSEKTAKPRSIFNKTMKINKLLKEAPSKESSLKEKDIQHSSYKSQQLIMPKNKPVLNKSNEKSKRLFNSFLHKGKEVDLKRMHLLKAFQNQEKSELKFEELQRNYKLHRTPSEAFKTQNKEVSKEIPNRLQMLKKHSVESIKGLVSKDNQRNTKPYSAPVDYHPSFPLSKPKKCESNTKKDEGGNSLKKRWTQLLDIFQSVITTEKKNWEQDSPERKLLAAGGSQLSKNALVPKAKITLRDSIHNPDAAAKRIQSYYRRQTGGDLNFQNNYSLSNRTNKM